MTKQCTICKRPLTTPDGDVISHIGLDMNNDGKISLCICSDCLDVLCAIREDMVEDEYENEEGEHEDFYPQEEDDEDDKSKDEKIDQLLEKQKEIEEKMEQKALKSIPKVTAKELYQFFQTRIIGQEKTKKMLSVAIANHVKKILHPELQLDKTNILLLGPTGSGKTEFARAIADYLQVPFTIADATSLTEAGYVGEDPSSILFPLIMQSKGNLALAEKGIVYVDEIDKLADSKGESAVKKIGVQQSLLKMLEGSEVSVKCGSEPMSQTVRVNTKNILFICSGAFSGLNKIIAEKEKVSTIGFSTPTVKSVGTKNTINHYLKDFGIIPELLGRLQVKLMLEKLTEQHLVDILTIPENSIVKQYEKLLSIDGVQLQVEPDALSMIAKEAIKLDTGARGLRTVMEELMLEEMFKQSPRKRKMKIDKKTVQQYLHV